MWLRLCLSILWGVQLQVAAYIYKYNIILRLDAYIYNINIYMDAYIYNNIILTNKVVIIPSATMFCHWVVDMDTIHLPLHRLPQELVWSSNDWSSNDRPYLSYDGFEIVPIFLSLVVNR